MTEGGRAGGLPRALSRGREGARGRGRRDSARSVGLPSVLTVLAALSAFSAPVHAQGNLTKRLDSRLDAPPFNRHLWGVALVDDKGKLLYGRNADRLFVPASNTKLVVSAVAAALLPADFSVKTSLYGTGPVVNGVLQGDLVLYGRGDPTFSQRCYETDSTLAGACDRDPMLRFHQLAEGLEQAGVRTVAGSLIGDGSYFEPTLVHAAWEGYDLNWWYAAPVSALGFNDNSVDIAYAPGQRLGDPATISWTPDLGDLTLENRTRTVAAGEQETIDFFREPGTLALSSEGTVALGSRQRTEYLALPDPNLYAARALRAALAARGIAVMGRTWSTTDSTLFAAARERAPLAEVSGRPLRDWIFPILNTSQNWYAEMLLKQVGRQFGTAGSWDEGLRVERRFLIDSVEIDSTQIALSDASGLSSINLVSPLAFTRLLAFIRKHPGWQVFAAGLPQSGNTGSLKNRFRGTPLEGRVLAKTGSIARVNTLSGFIETANGRFLTFSVMANHHILGGRAMLPQIDSVVVEMGKGR